ncbi:P-type conjugative transfer protein TrbJ [Bradyrhizobium stylosanthis]|uniref:P-type conjugative transfer protein TrbJ n=1 Tax=Bradyrhizobium stylosanthis TaxID=1803665 RepID=A0A560E2T2_9BRAD|nr:P-type conjugative transfer protein TrbJ [Bradyrhizobium stylosanthis]TWB03686.1 P-type conjugative transfer protein TrbJ [Bradyrhizobium stylosanthis]
MLRARSRGLISRAFFVVSVLLSLTIGIDGPSQAFAQSLVWDPWNYSQTLLSAARALDQINNQITSLENEAQMLINQSRHLTSLPNSVVGQLTSTINRLNSLVAQAKGISFDVDKARSDYERLYPRQYTASSASSVMVQDATSRWDNTYEGLKQALLTQATIASDLDEDRKTLSTLMTNSSAAVGSLQAQQSSNELLGLQAKQALQAQVLLLTQARAETLRAAEQQASVAAAQERFTRFIGDGHAYAAGK